MRNISQSKLLYFLSGFNVTERRRFREFIHSPIFNKHTETRLFFTYIEKYCLAKGKFELEEAAAKAFIWKGKSVPEGKLTKTKTHLLNLCMDYLSFRNWWEKKALRSAGLLQELNLLEDESYFEQYYEKGLRKALKDKERDTYSYDYLFGIESQMMIFRQKHGSRSKENHFEKTAFSLEKKLAGTLLKFYYISGNQAQIIGKEVLPEWMRELAQKIPWKGVEGEPLLEIWYFLNQTLASGSRLEDLDEVKKLILTHSSGFSAMEAYDIYTGAINNFSRQRQLRGPTLLQELFEIYQSMVEVYAREKGKGLQLWHFKNIVFVGARLGRFDWVESLLEEGPTLLISDGKSMERALNYNRGIFHFYKKEFDHAERFFNLTLPRVQDVFYATDARAYLLMCYYETGDTMGMEALSHSFRMFLSRNDRISEAHKARYLMFIRTFNLLLSTRPKDNLRLQKLKAEIEGLTFSAGKIWLLEKMDQL